MSQENVIDVFLYLTLLVTYQHKNDKKTRFESGYCGQYLPLLEFKMKY